MSEILFRARLEQMIDLKHPLAVLANRLPWTQLEAAALAPTRQQRRWLKRRQAVEPVIGHLKSDNRMDRCWLPGQLGEKYGVENMGSDSISRCLTPFTQQSPI